MSQPGQVQASLLKLGLRLRPVQAKVRLKDRHRLVTPVDVYDPKRREGRILGIGKPTE
jgi:hypothetical protein